MGQKILFGVTAAAFNLHQHEKHLGTSYFLSLTLALENQRVQILWWKDYSETPKRVKK